MNVSVEKKTGADSREIATILVNWRQPARTEEAVHAIMNQTRSSSIIVVDNDSKDDSLEFFEKNFSSNVKIIQSNTNGGFGFGVNKGLEHAYSLGAKYVWLLNNDAVPAIDCLEKLISVAAGDSRIGVVGARITDHTGSVPDHAGSVMKGNNFSCKYSMSADELNNAKFAWVTGACMLLNANALKEIGEFDPRFFMYWEDADLSCRLKNAGYRIGIANEAVVVHQAGTSSNENQLRRYEWHIHSQSLWVEKHFRPKVWGITIIYARNFIKSILDMNWGRFFLTLRCMLEKI